MKMYKKIFYKNIIRVILKNILNNFHQNINLIQGLHKIMIIQFLILILKIMKIMNLIREHSKF